MVNRKNKILIIGMIALVAFSIMPTFIAKAYLIPVTYEGFVKDRNGRAISNVLVTLYSDGAQVSTDYTDSTGYYCVGDFFIGSPYLKIEKTQWVTQTKSVSTRGGTYNFNLYSSACALIVAGSTDQPFNRDAFQFYNTLIDHYSFDASRIYLLTELTTIDGQTIPRDRAISQANVGWACDQIDTLTSTSDDVVVYWRSHGIKHSPFWPWDPPTYYTLDCGVNEMTRDELDGYLDGVPCNKMLVMVGSCFAGYFIGGGMDDESNRAILTSSSTTESSWNNGVNGYWNYGIYSALDPDLNADDADDNSNGRVSVWEFYDYADDYLATFEPFSGSYYQTPQYWAGSSFSLTGTYLGDQYY